ncbi:MAG: DUF2919 family protein [Gammaproteobacteria bacterium]
MPNQYPFSAYNKLLCLKLSIPAWATIVFLVRPFAIILMSVANRRDRMGVLNTMYGDPVSPALYIDAFAALPALLVIYAWVKRQPEAPQYIRWIWSRSRSILLLATALNILGALLPFILNPNNPVTLPDLAKLAACAMIINYLLSSKRLKDTFNDFPESKQDQEKESLRVSKNI